MYQFFGAGGRLSHLPWLCSPTFLVQAPALALLETCVGTCGPGGHEQPGAQTELSAPVGSREEGRPSQAL